MKASDLDALEAVARAATQGPWSYRDDDEGSSMGWIMVGEHTIADIDGDSAQQAMNAAHIATFDPPTVLRLIQTQRELVTALKSAAEDLDEAASIHECATCGRYFASARAAIAKASPPPSAEPGEGGSIQTLEASKSLPEGDA